MIKKVVFAAMVLITLALPAALADAAYPTYDTDGDFINVEYEVMTTEVEVGGEFSCEVTITNITNAPIIVYSVYLQGVGYFNNDLTMDSKDGEPHYLTLEPYEEITYKFSFIVDERINGLYIVEGDYFVDFKPVVKYSRKWEEYECLFKEISAVTVPVKIANLNDAGKFVEFEWIDGRDTFYYFYESVEDIGSPQGEKTYCEGETEVIYTYRNVSDIEMFGLAPGEEYTSDDYFEREDLVETIGDTLIYEKSFVFKFEGIYYCILESREYKVEFLECPEIKLEYQLVSKDIKTGTKTYEFSITNLSDEKVKNFFFSPFYMGLLLEEENFPCTDLNTGEVLKKEYTYNSDRSLEGIIVGYLLDGIIYAWEIILDNPPEENLMLNPVERFGYPYLTDYEWYLNNNYLSNPRDSSFDLYMYAEHGDKDNATEVVVDNLAAMPTIIPQRERETSYSPELTSTPYSEAIIKNRSNPMLWMLLIVLALVFIAAGLIAGVVRKKGKG